MLANCRRWQVFGVNCELVPRLVEICSNGRGCRCKEVEYVLGPNVVLDMDLELAPEMDLVEEMEG